MHKAGLPECLLHSLDPLLALRGGVDFKAVTHARGQTLAEQRQFGRRQCAGLIVSAADDFAEITVDVRVVVDDQDAPIDRAGFLATVSLRGIERQFECERGTGARPALCTDSDPPISLAAKAPLCKPNRGRPSWS